MSVSARKPHSLPHVKWVRKGLDYYGYFNTGQKKDGKPIRAPLGKFGSVGFFDRYSARMAGRTKRQTKTYTVADLAREYLASAEFADRAENTQKLYRTQLRKVDSLLGDFPADDLQPADVRDMLDAEEWNAATRNMVLAVIGVIYRWGRRRDKTTAHPARDVERHQGGQHEPWPVDCVEAGLCADDPQIRLSVHLLYFTGLRINDALSLRWGDIRGGFITVTPQKTARYRKTLEIPLLSELQAELDRTPKTGLLIMGGAEYTEVRNKLQAFTRKLGVHTVPHGLRKNAVNALLEAGCTVPEVAAITGQTHQIVEHYAAKVNRRKLGQAAIVKFETARNKSA